MIARAKLATVTCIMYIVYISYSINVNTRVLCKSGKQKFNLLGGGFNKFDMTSVQI